MAASDELGILAKAFSGFGVDEKVLITILGNWNSDKRQSFRKGNGDLFVEDERKFERWDDRHVLQLRHEFLRLKDAIVLWTMHPWERDARLLKESLLKGPQHNVLIEIACTRSSDELLGARKAYHSLFDHSIEEDIAFHIRTAEKKLLVGVLSSYRYEGPKVNEELAKLEARTLHSAVKESGNILIENEELISIISTRSKLHLQSVYNHYKGISGNYLDELLVGVLSSYRYEGPKVNEELAKLEARTLHSAVKESGNILIENEELISIISTRSKLHLQSVYNHYKGISGNYLDEDLDGVDNTHVRKAIQCLCTPRTYFSEVLDASLRYNADEITKEGVTRVIVTRTDVDIKQITQEYNHKYGIDLSKKIENVANGNYKYFLLTLLARAD